MLLSDEYLISDHPLPRGVYGTLPLPGGQLWTSGNTVGCIVYLIYNVQYSRLYRVSNI